MIECLHEARNRVSATIIRAAEPAAGCRSLSPSPLPPSGSMIGLGERRCRAGCAGFSRAFLFEKKARGQAHSTACATWQGYGVSRKGERELSERGRSVSMCQSKRVRCRCVEMGCLRVGARIHAASPTDKLIAMQLKTAVHGGERFLSPRPASDQVRTTGRVSRLREGREIGRPWPNKEIWLDI